MKDSHREEKLKDARDYRNVLINKREGIEKKITATEKRIHALKLKD